MLTKKDLEKIIKNASINDYNKPFLYPDDDEHPMREIILIELKKPGEDHHPTSNILDYITKLRNDGKEKTNVPAFCYVICNLTKPIIKRCLTSGLVKSSDHAGYFGYNENYQALIEVLPYDNLVDDNVYGFFDEDEPVISVLRAPSK